MLAVCQAAGSALLGLISYRVDCGLLQNRLWPYSLLPVNEWVHVCVLLCPPARAVTLMQTVAVQTNSHSANNRLLISVHLYVCAADRTSTSLTFHVVRSGLAHKNAGGHMAQARYVLALSHELSLPVLF